MRKNYYLLLDTETTQNDLVVDFAAIICDSKGRIYSQCAVLINGIYQDRENTPLFHNEKTGELWKKENLITRYNEYDAMLDKGERMLASTNAVNRWLENVVGKYAPTLTAYNLAFDTGKCANTGINLSVFSERFCLWHASAELIANKKKYLKFILDNHIFNAPTKYRNMSFKTNAETMARYVNNNPNMADEAHTALSDVVDYELPILQYLLKRYTKKQIMTCSPFSWRAVQVRDFYKVK